MALFIGLSTWCFLISSFNAWLWGLSLPPRLLGKLDAFHNLFWISINWANPWRVKTGENQIGISWDQCSSCPNLQKRGLFLYPTRRTQCSQSLVTLYEVNEVTVYFPVHGALTRVNAPVTAFTIEAKRLKSPPSSALSISFSSSCFLRSPRRTPPRRNGVFRATSISQAF